MNSILNFNEPIEMKSNVVIAKSEATLESVFQQVFYAEKCYNWFSFQPFVSISFSNDKYEIGTVAKLVFRCLPFRYKARCIEVKENQMIKAELVGGVKGVLTISILERNEEMILEYFLSIQGKNRYIHWYYILACYFPHAPYMKYCLQVLKKQAIHDSKER